MVALAFAPRAFAPRATGPKGATTETRTSRRARATRIGGRFVVEALGLRAQGREERGAGMDASALFRFSSGLYVVSATAGERAGACIVNTGLQVTSEPLQVSVTVNKRNRTADVIRKAGHFALAVVDESADMLFVGRFGFRSSADFDKFEGIESAEASTGDPYPMEHVCSFVACNVVQTMDVGTHLTFVGEVVDAGNLSDVAPMTYAYYHGTLKGKTPPRASSFVEGLS